MATGGLTYLAYYGYYLDISFLDLEMVKEFLHRFAHAAGERIFGHGQLRFVLLQLISDKPSHGYELIRAIEERLQGRYSPSPGVVYPALTMLEEQGYIEQAAQEDGGRKVFSATDAGRAFLEQNREVVDAALARMDHGSHHGHHGHHGGFGHRGRGDHPPQVLRALENLKMAVRMRMHGAPLDADQAHAFAAVLDSAAQQIERI